MKKLIYLISIFTILFFSNACSNNENGSDTYTDDTEVIDSETETYPDGTYCAEVTYYNPNTGTRNTYTLEVEVANNELVTIYWGNGGWLDQDHFSAEELDSDGSCSFTSDKGYQYDIQIIGQSCGYTDKSSFQNDMQEDEEALICPKCGDDKYEYDEYCYSCERKIKDEEENTCSRCGGFEYYVNGGLCSNCKEEDENNEF